MSSATAMHCDASVRQARKASKLDKLASECMMAIGFQAVDTIARRCAQLPVRIGALELTQQPVATLDGGIQCRLRGFLAAERLLKFVVDHIANQNERAEPDALRIFGRRFQGNLLDRNRGAGIAVVKTLRAGQVEGRAGHREIAGVLMPGSLNLRLRQKTEALCDARVF